MPSFSECVSGGKGEFGWLLMVRMEVVEVRGDPEENRFCLEMLNYVLVLYWNLELSQEFGFITEVRIGGERIEFKTSHSLGQSNVSDTSILWGPFHNAFILQTLYIGTVNCKLKSLALNSWQWKIKVTIMTTIIVLNFSYILLPANSWAWATQFK